MRAFHPTQERPFVSNKPVNQVGSGVRTPVYRCPTLVVLVATNSVWTGAFVLVQRELENSSV